MLLNSITPPLFSVLCVFLVFFCNCVNCYNLSPKPNVIFRDPQLATGIPKYESSYFGFSLNLRPNGIIVGAPRAQSTLELQSNVNETGAIYRCSLSQTSPCYPFVFEYNGNRTINASLTYDSERRNNQWLGASMDGGLNDTDKLIVCAPRFIAPIGRKDYLMHGICYWIKDTLADMPTNVRKISPLRLKTDQIRTDKTERYHFYMLAEEGLSAHITPDNKEFLIGCPGIYIWKGSVIRYHKQTLISPPPNRRDTKTASGGNVTQFSHDTMVSGYESEIPNPKSFDQPGDSYFGYSVSSGYFDSNDKTRLMYVATAPRAYQQSGEAYVFDFKGASITKNYVFRGQQFGEYFGYAVLTEDINGDGLSDVIVSAPQYSISGIYDDGAIYVFINQGKFNFEYKLLPSPIHGPGRFGTTLTRLGDINHDGYNDIAVGAPFAGDGSVFVYLGSESGLRDQHSQRFDSPKSIIRTSYVPHMFGHGLSKGSDIDGNGFNDLAIGAPNAETVLLYKAYPVVKIVAYFGSLTREIKPDQKSFVLNVCYSILTTSTKMHSQELAFHVVVDPQVKRVTILSNGETEIKFNATAETKVQCKSFDCIVNFSQSDVFKAIELELHYSLINQIPDSEVFCETCAVVDPAETKVFTEKVIFSTGCETEICIADMQVQSVGLNHTFILGSNRTLSVTYEVSNFGETAYLPQISLTSSNRMPFAKSPSNCKINDAVMLCDLNRRQAMKKGAKDSFTVLYDVSSLSGTSMILTATALSTGKELTPGNNFINDTVTLVEFTTVEAIGVPKTAAIRLEKDSKSAEVVNYFEIKSNGPSNVRSMEIIIYIPVAYKIIGSEDIIPIIDIHNVTMKATYDSQLVDIDFYQNDTQLIINTISRMSSGGINNEHSGNHTDLELDDLGPLSNRRRRRREAVAPTAKNYKYAHIANSKFYDFLSDDLKRILPGDRTIIFNCNDTEITTCVKAVIHVYNFKPEKPLVVSMAYNIDLKKINEILIEPWQQFVLLFDLDVIKTTGLSSTFAVTKKIYPNIISKLQLHEIPIWTIVLAVLGGILIWALLTYGMYKAGFFKRFTKEEMLLVHQAKLYRKSVCEVLHNDESY